MYGFTAKSSVPMFNYHVCYQQDVYQLMAQFSTTKTASFSADLQHATSTYSVVKANFFCQFHYFDPHGGLCRNLIGDFRTGSWSLLDQYCHSLTQAWERISIHCVLYILLCRFYYYFLLRIDVGRGRQGRRTSPFSNKLGSNQGTMDRPTFEYLISISA